MDDWKILAGGGTGLTTIVFAWHFLRSTTKNAETLATSLTKSLDSIVINMGSMRDSMIELNVKLATVIAKQENSEATIIELKSDIKELQKGRIHENIASIN